MSKERKIAVLFTRHEQEMCIDTVRAIAGVTDTLKFIASYPLLVRSH